MKDSMRQTALIVEDDPGTRHVLSSTLATAGIDSIHAATGAAMWQQLDHAPDIIILDLSLPDGSGLEILRRWRHGGVNLPTLIITARTALQDRLEGLDLGADDFIVKPFATAELLSRVRAVVRRSRRQASDVWVFDDLTIEPHRHAVQVAGRDPQLSLREFQLLVELARDYGQVVPKAVLAQRLNPLGEPLETGAIEVHMSNLRKKIGSQRICTVRGVGYMLGK